MERNAILLTFLLTVLRAAVKLARDKGFEPLTMETDVNCVTVSNLDTIPDSVRYTLQLSVFRLVAFVSYSSHLTHV